ncbi:3-hydroxyacyl-CoA dehydrogenase [Bordetella trematum]|uniref:Fatty oxidation complex alpha subunit n=1 Tax=Bordetella trematum TaxID=123899 RepID=A0A157SQ72_9BORD|nr:3-hydroxyacyl-CoA dehydrogenase NAD-binding domain-containing protein [Bordetella trematum]AZR94072.1 3-hydroxyacyl-CoA dehydrogenase [Bordetella trematum]NNH18444.1 3-hydroxyacyl-CoA dehydrogenase [Bordetella trematum]SAH80498.1 fatty oxidation complex alpha subunit [Bordetella trematum]SAI72562.1 fatty oxidation complex alpha subunit [Bordetella trematum]SUV97761.1 fatty oxidation complex alpha subunit [Bordetella trematum]
MTQLAYQVLDGIALIVMQNPPVNSMGHIQRRQILNALERSGEDAQIRAVVITGSEEVFSGGADITEFGTPKANRQPTLRDIIEALDEFPKPVIAAIDGICLGGGLELALAAHYRIATRRAVVGLPEVKLGLLPGAGGTQRLPRLVGLERGLDMIVHGKKERAAALADTRLFDLIVEDGVADAAVAFARRRLEAGDAPPRTRDIRMTEPDAEAFLQVVRRNISAANPRFPAPMQCVEAVAGCLLPFDEGIRKERALFVQLMSTPESAALRHVFAAERAAAKVPGITKETPRRVIQRVGVVGAGTMGTGICMSFLNAGIPVTLLDLDGDVLARGVATIRKHYDATMRKGRISATELEKRMSLLGTTRMYGDLKDADLVVEAVFEDMAIKEKVFRALDEALKPGAILATNTSTLDVNVIAGFVKRPEDVLGLHFFSPANVMRLLEIVRADRTSAEVLATALAVAKTIGKQPVVSGVCDGFIGNRMLNGYRTAGEELLLLGASPREIDRALEDFGFAMGPYRMGDLAGLDIGWAIRKRRQAEHPDRDFSSVADRLCEAGRFGQKTGAGWYRYEEGGRIPHEDPVVADILDAYRRENSIEPSSFTPREIVDRCVFALVNEGARIVEEGVSQRVSDLDIVYLNGYGFPLQRGGPMHYAQQVGIFNVVRALRRFAAHSRIPDFWQPAALLSSLANSGEALT